MGAAAAVLLYAVSTTLASGDPIHHRLTVRLEPEAGRITVTDRLTLGNSGGASPTFQLRAGFEVEAKGATLRRSLLSRDRVRSYELRKDPGATEVVLRYSGRVESDDAHPEHGMPRAVVSKEGVYLDGASAWYPVFGDTMVSFEMDVTLPPGWQAISQGRWEATEGRVRWTEKAPQDDIYLVAGPFHRYAAQVGEASTEVYLLGPDPGVAERYLAALARYLPVYERLLGPYPYAKFAVVENRWETGYGMPSFTLLGSRVLRLPFILDSSLPHELVHNWWGNGVYIDFRDGNWSEGLTAYLSDYLVEEAKGRGVQYRRGALQKYDSFAAERRDAPLREFRARHDQASQAIGYGKSLMLFHMLRREMGDEAFLAGLRRFAAERMFRSASFTDLLATLEAEAGRPLRTAPEQWLSRPGAPAIALGRVASVPGGEGGRRLIVTLSQTQEEPPFILDVPIAVTLRDRPEALIQRGRFTGEREVTLDVELDAEPLRVDVDPGFEVFRRLAPGEVPPSLGTLLGDDRQLIVVPEGATTAEQRAWRELAAQWAQRFPGVETADDKALSSLPTDRAVWVLGWDNRWAGEAARRLAGDRLDPAAGTADVGGIAVDRQRDAVVLVAPTVEPMPLGFIGAEGTAAIAGLARKLPHYSRFGRLIFERATVDNTYKDERPSDRSALTRVLAEEGVARAALPAGPVMAPDAVATAAGSAPAEQARGDGQQDHGRPGQQP
jgi:hypothetical protein